MPSFHTLVLVTLLALTNLAAAGSVQPPACLLGALQRLPNPADFAAVCGSEQTWVAHNLTEVCTGTNIASAYSAYSATCMESAGMSVKPLSTSSSIKTKTGTTATATATASAKTTGTTTSTGTHKTATAGATATASGSGTAAAATQTGSSSAAGPAPAPQPALFVLSGLLATGLASLLFL